MKFMCFCVSIVFCMLLMVSAANAQGQPTSDPCMDKAQTTAEMRDCVGKDYAKADRELNQVYRQLMSVLSDRAQAAALKTAQQAWLKYRDSNCEFEAFENRGGTIYPVVYGSCLANMTRLRTKEMREQIEAIREQD